MNGQSAVNVAVAFVAGFLSFLSPCIFPLIPFYVFYITGVAAKDKEALASKKLRGAIALHTIFFILGFSVIFVALGLSFSYFGRLLFNYKYIIQKVAGVLIVLFGLSVTGLINLEFLRGLSAKVNIKNRKLGFFGSFLVGTVFAFTWTPCAGPILGSILTLASTEGNLGKGAALLSVYSLGVAVPFFLSAILFDYFLIYSKTINKYIRIVSIVSGIFLVIVGVLVFTDSMSRISAMVTHIFK